MRKVLVAFFFSVLIVSASHAAPGGAVHCGKLVDVRAGRVLGNQLISFDAEGTITSVTPAGSSLPAGTIDLAKATCLHGLIDVHTHITGEPSHSGYAGLGISVPRSAVTGAKNARLTLIA